MTSSPFGTAFAFHHAAAFSSWTIGQIVPTSRIVVVLSLEHHMFGRQFMRALWLTVILLAVVGGATSLGAATRATWSASGGPSQMADNMSNAALTFEQLAPLLALTALLIAVAGWKRLHDELLRVQAHELTLRDRVRRLDGAIHASAEGFFLMRALRSTAGEVLDFEITDVNPTGAALIRQDGETLVGQRLRRDLTPVLGLNVIDRYVRVLETQTPLLEEVRVHPRRFAAGWLGHSVVPTADGLAITLQDISARKDEEIRLRRATVTDDLTQLYNRRGFLTLSEQQLRVARRQQKDAVLLYVDMDHFKQLNDEFGHAEGDRALVAMSRLLRSAVRDCDIVARMGGDEFTILAIDADGAAARIIQRRIEERVALLNASGEFAGTIALTIGYTRVRPTDHASLVELLARADVLLYARKKRRKLVAAAQTRAGARHNARLPRAQTAMLPSTLVTPDVSGISRDVGVARPASTPSTYAPLHSP